MTGGCTKIMSPSSRPKMIHNTLHFLLLKHTIMHFQGWKNKNFLNFFLFLFYKYFKINANHKSPCNARCHSQQEPEARAYSATCTKSIQQQEMKERRKKEDSNSIQSEYALYKGVLSRGFGGPQSYITRWKTHHVTRPKTSLGRAE
eukprot:1265427-Ditylum_brightwellii.AAC.1